MFRKITGITLVVGLFSLLSVASVPALGTSSNSMVRQDLLSNALPNLSSLDQSPIETDNSYWYPSRAGSGVTIYAIDDWSHNCPRSDKIAAILNSPIYGVAKSANVVKLDAGKCNLTSNINSLDESKYILNAPEAIDAVNTAANLNPNGQKAVLLIPTSYVYPLNNRLNEAIIRAIEDGIYVISGVGSTYDRNEPESSCQMNDARWWSALRVGAVTADLKFLKKYPEMKSAGNYDARCLDIMAPGIGILGASSNPNAWWATFPSSGTSLAAAHVAAVAAIYISENPSANFETFKSELLAGADSGIDYSEVAAQISVGAGPDKALDISFMSTLDNVSTPKFTVDSFISPLGSPTSYSERLSVISGTWAGDSEIKVRHAIFRCKKQTYWNLSDCQKYLTVPALIKDVTYLGGSELFISETAEGAHSFRSVFVKIPFVEFPKFGFDPYEQPNQFGNYFWVSWFDERNDPRVRYALYVCNQQIDEPGVQVPPGCVERKTVQPESEISDPKLVGKYLLAAFTGPNGMITTKSTDKIQPGLVTLSDYRDLTSLRVGQKFKQKLIFSNTICKGLPRELTATFRDSQTGFKKSQIHSIKSCAVNLNFGPVASNSTVTISIKKSSATQAFTKTLKIEVWPRISAKSSPRTFGRYSLVTRADAKYTGTCTVYEDWSTFSGLSFATKSYQVRLVRGISSVSRYASYVGVIYGQVTCPATKFFGASNAAFFKVFSY